MARRRRAPKTAAQLKVRSKSDRVAKQMLRGGKGPIAYDRPGHTGRAPAKASGKKGRGSAAVRGVSGNIIGASDAAKRKARKRGIRLR